MNFEKSYQDCFLICVFFSQNARTSRMVKLGRQGIEVDNTRICANFAAAEILKEITENNQNKKQRSESYQTANPDISVSNHSQEIIPEVRVI